MSDAVVDEACYWIVQLDADEIPPEEHSRFIRWLNESPEHGKAMEDVRNTWQRYDAVQRLHDEPASSRMVGGWLRTASDRRRIVPFAAAAAVVAIGFGLWLMQSPAVYQMEYRTAIGEQRRIVLPDDSVMILNTNSRAGVRYSQDGRTIELQQGEGHFEVSPAEDRPFIVLAGAGGVRAVGTEFTVYRKESAIEVTVAEGTVEVLPARQAAREVTVPAISDEAGQLSAIRVLTARHKLRYENGAVETMKVTEEEIKRTLAWRDGMLDFQNAPLGKVIAEASRYIQDEVIIVDPELESHEFTGYFRAGDVALLVDLLESNGFIEARWVDHDTVHIGMAAKLPN